MAAVVFRNHRKAVRLCLQHLFKHRTALCESRPWTPQASCGPLVLVRNQLHNSPIFWNEQKDVKTTAPASTEIQVAEVPSDDPEHKKHLLEYFIPITRRSLVRRLMQEKDWLNEEELRKFEQFAISLDSALVNRYHAVLQELKVLFDPINPDKDTVATRQLNRRERLDNEFWLLQKLAGVMEKANFHELPRTTVDRLLQEHSARERVLVSVNPDNYDILRVWVLGKEQPPPTPSRLDRARSALLRRPTPHAMEYYKRVVVAVRPKTHDKLLLKAFKEVPVDCLEQLLPDGKIKMTKFDKNIIGFTVGIAGLGLLGKVITTLAHIDVEWTLGVALVTGLVGFRAYAAYKNKRNQYLVELSRMLYFKNIANNRGLLTLLVDRAEDELFKEALLTYTFLLTNRPPSTRDKHSVDQSPDELGVMPNSLLENKVADWVYNMTGSRIWFNSAESIALLQELGILSCDLENNLHVLPIEAASHLLPQQPQSLAARVEESDIMEGYDREPEEEDESEYKEWDKKLKKFFKWK